LAIHHDLLDKVNVLLREDQHASFWFTGPTEFRYEHFRPARKWYLLVRGYANGTSNDLTRATFVSNTEIVAHKSSGTNQTVSPAFFSALEDFVPLVSPFDELLPSVELSPEPLDPHCALCSVS
jgi:hypothetical protein